MKYYVAALITCYAAFSCKSQYDAVSVKINAAGEKVRVNVPKGYTRETVLGDSEYEQKFIYSDSSVFYVSTFNNTSNYDDIRQSNQYGRWFDAIHSEEKALEAFYGRNKNSFFWKDIVLGNVIVGYTQADSIKSKKFDATISRFIKRYHGDR